MNESCHVQLRELRVRRDETRRSSKKAHRHLLQLPCLSIYDIDLKNPSFLRLCYWLSFFLLDISGVRWRLIIFNSLTCLVRTFFYLSNGKHLYSDGQY